MSRANLNKTYEDLIPRKQAFVDAYLKHGDRDQAYLDAGYTPSRRALKANAYNLYRELEHIIRQQIDKRIGTGAITALNIIKELMEDKKQSGAVRLQAAKDYLSRAGYDKPVESTLTIDDLRGVEDKELKSEIEALLGQATKKMGPTAA